MYITQINAEHDGKLLHMVAHTLQLTQYPHFQPYSIHDGVIVLPSPGSCNGLNAIICDPLDSNHDALNIAIHLGLSIIIHPASIEIRFPLNGGIPLNLIGASSIYVDTTCGIDKRSAVRYGITCAAAKYHNMEEFKNLMQEGSVK